MILKLKTSLIVCKIVYNYGELYINKALIKGIYVRQAFECIHLDPQQ